MRTMFPTQAKNAKKRFQKPNILRKKPKKPVKANGLGVLESPETKPLVNPSCGKEEVGDSLQLGTIELHDPLIQSEWDLSIETEIGDGNDNYSVITSPVDNTKLVLENNNETLIEDVAQENNIIKNADNTNPSLVNIESFFNESAGEKIMLCDIDFESGKQTETLVVINGESSESAMYVEPNSNVANSMVPLSAVTNQTQDTNEQEMASATTFPNVYSTFTPIVKYKCDVPNCTKEFRSEHKYNKHKNAHDKDGGIKAPRQVTIECPVKKVEADGTEKPCGQIFPVREQLLKHLNEEHTPEDAVYRCGECGRRFFWAMGLRTHVRAHCRAAAAAGAALVCAWPGCGRAFRQPCRLREHARVHTGDRPYPCHHPNCGWSFRSASKLKRHARRHTGERRHACALCGRGFLRRDHLRDHAARHHAPHARRKQPCTHPGCERTFNNMSSLYLHVKKVHKKKETVAPATTTTETLYTVSNPSPDMFMVSLVAESPCAPSVDVGVEGGEGAASRAGQAARTHCTWPLQRAPPSDADADADADNAADADADADAADDDLLEDDSQVEQSEGSESTYTVRSDLFLHGNVLINEDSEHMGVGADSLGGDLGLLDAHPTIDLMQEELMYADTAADESSFRIFLLSGEEVDLIT